VAPPLVRVGKRLVVSKKAEEELWRVYLGYRVEETHPEPPRYGLISIYRYLRG